MQAAVIKSHNGNRSKRNVAKSVYKQESLEPTAKHNYLRIIIISKVTNIKMNLHKKKNTTDWTAASSRYSFAELNSKWRALCVPIDIFKYMSKIQINFGVCVCVTTRYMQIENVFKFAKFIYTWPIPICVFLFLSFPFGFVLSLDLFASFAPLVLRLIRFFFTFF